MSESQESQEFNIPQPKYGINISELCRTGNDKFCKVVENVAENVGNVSKKARTGLTESIDILKTNLKPIINEIIKEYEESTDEESKRLKTFLTPVTIDSIREKHQQEMTIHNEQLITKITELLSKIEAHEKEIFFKRSSNDITIGLADLAVIISDIGINIDCLKTLDYYKQRQIYGMLFHIDKFNDELENYSINNNNGIIGHLLEIFHGSSSTAVSIENVQSAASPILEGEAENYNNAEAIPQANVNKDEFIVICLYKKECEESLRKMIEKFCKKRARETGGGKKSKKYKKKYGGKKSKKQRKSRRTRKH